MLPPHSSGSVGRREMSAQLVETNPHPRSCTPATASSTHEARGGARELERTLRTACEEGGKGRLWSHCYLLQIVCPAPCRCLTGSQGWGGRLGLSPRCQ